MRIRYPIRAALYAALVLGLLSAMLLKPARATVDQGAALIDAVRAGRLDTLRELVARGADIDAAVPGDGTALIQAARRRDPALVAELLRLGAQVDRSVRGDGNALIAAAAQRDNLAVLRRLVEAGADVDAVVEDDETPLINAARSGDLAAVAYLVERGADVNLGVSVRAHAGAAPVWRSPLNQARADTVRRYLLERGARR
ncbi:ankyrin repeat domain-containing protein [Lysobacter sp. CCNWLW3]|uniref:ankyrin repeat domain-containing protein n=1 Tax=unclassified Lysobacter TaxID=2635362 RepID=UPI002FCF36F7